MKKLVLMSVVALTAWSAVAMAEQVGVVDMKAIFADSQKAKEIKTQLEKQFNPQKEKLQKMAQTLQENIQNYQKNQSVTDKKALAAEQDKITKEENTFRDEQAKFQQDVMKTQNEKLEQFVNNIKQSVKTVAEKNKLDLVIPSNDVLYSKEGMDITKQVQDDLK